MFKLKTKNQVEFGAEIMESGEYIPTITIGTEVGDIVFKANIKIANSKDMQNFAHFCFGVLCQVKRNNLEFHNIVDA